MQIEYRVALTIITDLRIGNAVSAPWGENIKELNTIESGCNVHHNSRKTPWNKINILKDYYLAGWHRDNFYVYLYTSFSWSR